MMRSDRIKRLRVKESIEEQCRGQIEDKISRYLEVEHQGIISGHYFARVSSECIYLYRDGYFIGAVMMSHAINEGIIKFMAERNNIKRGKDNGNTKSIANLIDEFHEKGLLSDASADASMAICKSFRADIHHMNPKVGELDFQELAQQNLKRLATIEREIFYFKIDNGIIDPKHPKYWDINADGTATAFLRLDM